MIFFLGNRISTLHSTNYFDIFIYSLMIAKTFLENYKNISIYNNKCFSLTIVAYYIVIAILGN